MKKSTNFIFWQKIYFFLLSVFLSGFAYGQVSAYGFSQSNGTYTPITGGTVYSSNTTTTLDAEVYTNLPIGFTFVYNGISYDRFGMNVNGWISMGSTAPVSSHTPISTGTTNNVISAAAMDLFGRQFFTGSTTSGSAAVAMTAGSTLGISVGDAMSGTGITTGSLVNAVTTNNVTMNANATTTGTGRNIRFHNGTIRYETIGAAPNRKLVVQWSKFSRYATGAPSDYFNFQIVLNEGSNIINFIYDFPYVNASNIFEVGLRGAASTDFNNRTTTSNWASTTAGTSNTATSTATNTIFPASGLTYTWTPPTCFSPTGLTSSNVTSSTATISWTAPAPAPASGYDYYRSTSSTAPTASTTPTGSTLAGNTTADLTSLSAGTSYYFWVRGKCSDTDFSNWSSQGTFTTACNLPSEPAPISFSAASATATTITWTAPTTAPTGYVVFRSTSNVAPMLTNGTQYTVNNTTAVSSLNNGTNTYFCIYNGTALATTQSALTANTQYYYYVFSRNGTTGVSPDCSGAPWYSSANTNGSKTTCAGAPTAFTSSAITTNSATIGWTAPTGGTAGTLSYTVEVYTDSGYTTAVSGYPVAGVSATTYNLTGLSASTIYYVRIKANNGACDSTYLTGNFATSCAPDVAPTTVQTFATYTGAAPNPVCWSEATGTVGAPSTLTITNSAWISSTGFANTGTNVGAKINLYSTKNEWLISKQIDLGSTAGMYRLKYNMAVTNYNGTTAQTTLGTHTVRVIVSSDGGATWTSANTVKTYTGAGTYSNTGQWETIDLTGYSGIIKVAFVASTTATTPDIDFHIDDFSVELIPSCNSTPTGLTSSSIQATKATISWTAPATAPASGYHYYINTSSTAPTASTTPTGSTLAGTTTADLTSLSAGTIYYFWVRGKCSDTDFSNWSSQGTFTTACNLPSEPASISFSPVSATATTISWTAPTTAPTAYVVFRSTSNVAPTLTNGTQYTVNSTTAVSSLTNGTNTYFCIYNGTALTTTQSALTANTQYYYYIFSRNGTTGVSPDCSGAPWYSSANTNGSKTTCPAAPTAFASSAITTNSATIGWTAPTGGTAGALSYTVEVYTDSGYTTAVSGYPVAGITTNTYNLTGLSTSTPYYIRVKANNGSCDSSYLTGTLTTSQVLASLDFTDGFEGTNNWSFVNGTQTNKWVVGSAAANGGTKSLYISNDAGTTNAYTETSATVVQAYRDIEIPTGTTNLELSFDWKANGESTWDYLRVWLVPLSYVPTAGTQITSGSGRIQVGGNLNLSTAFATYQNYNVNFSTFAGQNVRLVFEWTNDGSGGTQSPAAIDNVSLKKPCAAVISTVTNGENCGTGTVTLSATGNTSTTEYKWYVAATGGPALATTSGSWTTPSISSTTTYYVAASTGVCESVNRTAVTATIKPFPTAVDITNTNASICGGTVQTLTATGGLTSGDVIVGTGTSSMVTNSHPNPFNAWYGGVKHQMIYTAAELSAQGLVAGSTIKSVGFNISAFLANPCTNFTIRMKHTSASTLSAFEAGTTTVYNSSTFTPSATGWSIFILNNTFVWDGTSNLIVETVHNAGNAGNGQGTTVTYTTTSGNTVYYGAKDNVAGGIAGFDALTSWTSSGSSANRPNAKFAFENQKIVWSPNTNLYTDAACTTAYDGTSHATTLYAKPTSTITYTAKSANGTCEVTDNVTFTVPTATYDNTLYAATGGWSETPDATKGIIINDDLATTADISGCSLTVNAGKKLTINNAFTVDNAVTNNGEITVNDGGNFLQGTNSIYTAGIGSTFKLNKNSASAANKYVFWSSPVVGQNIYGIYGAAGTPTYVMTYNTATDYYDIVTNPVSGGTGIGYSVKVPADSSPVTFQGTPNNGNLTVTLNSTANANGNTWNLIGNPYPSNLNLKSLYNGGTNGIFESMYFWDTVTSTTQQEQNATGWRIFNAVSETWTNGNTNTNGISVKPGQGFIVKAIGSSTLFTNAMRNSATSSTFVNKAVQSTTEGKYWVKITTPASTQSTIAITYGQGAQNTLDLFDSKMMSTGTNAIYSYINNADKLAIQGRDNFVNTDVVILGNKHSVAGQYTISLHDKSGLFANGQEIYLKDKLLGTYTNLQQSSYTFTSDALEQQNRFEIVYQNNGALNTSDVVKNELVIYKDGEQFTVNSPSKIKTIEVYDAAGRLVKELKPNTNKTSFVVESKGIYVVKVITEKETVTKKVIK